MSYEVEIRFVVDSPADAFTLLPFLKESLGEPSKWATEIIGRSIFDGGRLLRVGRTDHPGDGQRRYIGYKGPDLGTFANIREEWGEEITKGVTNSEILSQIGIDGTFNSAETVLAALATAGHQPFMRFSGVDRLGYHEPLSVHTKLARCPAIVDERVLVELEIEASSLAEAREAESKLTRIAEEYGVVDLLTRDEPPTMLYKRTLIKR